MSIAEHIVRVTEVGADGTAIDFEGASLSWSALGSAIRSLGAQLDAAGLGRDSLIGLLGRNRLAPLAGFVATLGTGRALLLVNAIQPVPLIAKELADLRLCCLVGSKDDLGPEVVLAATQVGTMVIEISVEDGVVCTRVRQPMGTGPFRAREPGTLIEIQTSGTTGTPKRIPVAEHTVESSLNDGVRSAKGAVGQAQLQPKTSPTLMFSPMVHTSGTFNTLMSVFEVRTIVLFEKFDAQRMIQMLRQYRPKFLPLPPSALKMMVDSAATREDFASVLAVRAGTAALPVALQDEFESRFGVPVLTTYGATEFMGVVTSWTLDDHRRYAKDKRGSVGRVSKGVQIRVVDPANGDPLPAGEQGVLEAKLDRIDGGREWIRTTDLAKIDVDGFLFILGRADDAIIRGGFKVMAGKVGDVLRRCPGVNEVIVIGRPDERLGEVPVAVVEPNVGTSLDESSLRRFAKEQLVPYEVPARFHVVERLPRTISDKVSRVEVKRMLDALEQTPVAAGN